MAIDLNLEIRVDYIHDPLWVDQNIRLGILRLDQIHPLISGNKWFKLKENIRAAQMSGRSRLLTFGGAFSNHLIATAAAVQALDMKSIGLVRGFHASTQQSATLESCVKLGMKLVFVSREAYRWKSNPEFLLELQQKYPDAWIIPEGGNNEEGRFGVREIVDYLPKDADIIALPIGSGTTFSGLRNCIHEHIRMFGFAGFKNGAYLVDEINKSLVNSQDNWDFYNVYHFGGFAKHKPELIGFVNSFYDTFKIPLDFVYTGKMMFGLFDLLKKHLVPENSHLIAIHTGGLQGNGILQDLLVW